MSEQKSSFMAELDQWSQESVIGPLYDALMHGPEEVIVAAKMSALRAIRAKVLESYRNGQAAGPQPERRRGHDKR